MNLPEQTINPGCGSRTGKGTDILSLSGRCPAGTARQLHRVCCIEDHRVAHLAHDHQRTHIGHQVVIAEGRAPFRQQNLLIAGRFNLLDAMLDIPGSKKLPLFQIDRLAGFANRHQQIGLPAEKGRNLQDIEHLGSSDNLTDIMDIRNHRQVKFVFDPP